MNLRFAAALLENAALLVALVAVLDLVLEDKRQRESIGRQVLLGVVLAAIGTGLMLISVPLADGIVFDTRSVLLAVAGLFLGVIPTTIAMVIMAVVRLSLGGAAAGVGIGVILATGTLGLVWRRWRKGALEDIRGRELLGFGLVVHLVMLALMFLLPRANAVEVVKTIGVPVLIVYPLATAALGLLLARRLRRVRAAQELVANVHHITEQRRAEQALRESELRWQMALEATGDGAWEWNVVTGEAKFSPGLATMLGYDPADVQPRIEEWETRIHPEDRERTLRELSRYVSGETGSYACEHRLRCKDGSYSWVLDRGKIVERTPDGRPVRMIGTHANVTARRRQQEQVADALAFVQTIIRAVPIAVSIYTPDGRRVEANPAAETIPGDGGSAPLCEADFRASERWRKHGLLAAADQALAARTEQTLDVELPGGDGRGVALKCQFVPFTFHGEVRLLMLVSDETDARWAASRVKESEERYRMLFEGNPRPMWIYDLETLGVLAVNEAAVLAYGYSRAEFLALSILALRPADDVPRFREELREFAQGLDFSGTRRHRHKNGDIRDVEVRAHTIRWLGRRARVVMVDDVTAQRQAEAAMRQSEERFRRIFNFAYDAIVVTDPQQRIIDCNPATLRLFATTREMLIGRMLWGLSPALQPDGEPSAAKAGRILAEIAAGAAAFEWRHRRSAGGDFDAEIHLSRVGPGGAEGMMAMIRDLTERKKAFARLHLLQSALQATPHSVVITDADGRIEWVNPSFTRITGYNVSEAMGQNPRLLKSGQHPPEFYAQMWQEIRRGELWQGEITNRRKDGQLYQEAMTIAPVRTGDGMIEHFVAIKQDITEQKRMEQRLLRAQRMETIGLLAGGIAHDLNNVLAPILLSIGLLRRPALDRSTSESLDLMEAAAKRGAGFVRQVLTFARGMDGERVPLHVRDLIRELTGMIRQTFPRNIVVRSQEMRGISPVLGDMTQLHQVLLNLSVNARDAMPEGGTLAFRTSGVNVVETHSRYMGAIKPGDYVLISVSDTGTGIPPDHLERIFEPFFTTKAREKGTGLGLATVHGIVRSHGGFIDVQSELGRGSEFHVYLPAAPHATPDAAVPERAMNLIGRGRTILVCDDEVPIRQVAAAILARHEFTVLEASNGREALTLFEANRGRIDVVLTDIMMPLMTGDRAVEQMLRQAPDLPVLFMSGVLEEVSVSRGQDLRPGSVLLRKPFSGEELLEALDRVLTPA